MTGDRPKQAPPSGEMPPARSGLTLSVRDFGPIAEGEVDLRPLTIFAGPSNTGKSWLATLVYALERCLPVEQDRFWPTVPRVLGLSLTQERGERSALDFPQDPEAWLNAMAEGGALPLTVGDRRFLKTLCETQIDTAFQELTRCFGLSDFSHFVRENGEKTASVMAVTKQKRTSLSTEYRLNFSEKNNGFAAEILSDALEVNLEKEEIERFQGLLLDRYFTRKIKRDNTEEQNFHLQEFFASSIYSILSSQHFSTFFLPADRGGIMHAHSVVVRTLIQSASRAGLSSTPPLPALSGVLADFLEHLVEMATERPDERGENGGGILQSDPIELSKRMEKAILRGGVHVDRSEVSYPRFAFQPAGWKRSLPLMNASSMVTELAPVVLFLRHLVRPGDLLILEEPEAHLHPAMQVKFVQEIATCVENGIQVLLTTHSEWVLEELANIVARSESGAKGAALPKEQVGLWLFDHKKPGSKASGSTIREIEWNPDEGGFDAQYDKVAMALHNDWAALVDGAA